MAKWLPPNGFTGKVHHLDAKVGGTYKMSFTNFTTGKSHSFGGKYVELVPHQRIRYTDKFDDPNLPGEYASHHHLEKGSCGTELNIVQEGVPDVIPSRSVLSRLAGIAHAAGEAGRGGDSLVYGYDPAPRRDPSTPWQWWFTAFFLVVILGLFVADICHDYTPVKLMRLAGSALLDSTTASSRSRACHSCLGAGLACQPGGYWHGQDDRELPDWLCDH